MNCGDFRYLIQRRFDVELSSSDDRALLIHLETCESCQKFYHQVQQVIIAAEEMSLPEDLLPLQPELLSNKIFQNIPQYESGILASVAGFFSRLAFLRAFKKPVSVGSGQSNPIDPINSTRLKPSSPVLDENWAGVREGSGNQAVLTGPTTQTEDSASGRVIGAWGAWSTNQVTDSNNPPLADLVNRADAASGMQAEPADEQRATRSLGEKFSRFATSQSDSIAPAGANQPLTLAESIRRRIAEMPKPAPAEVINHPESGEVRAEGGTEDTDSHYDADTFGEWGIPHSPDWPKINADLDLKQTLDNSNNTNTAPNSWGKAEGSWGNRASNQDRQPTNIVTDNQKPGGWVEIASNDISHSAPDYANAGIEAAANEQSEESLLPQPRHWSQEAEQLETGSWQSVDFEAEHLGAGAASQSLIPAQTPFGASPSSSDNQWNLSIQERIASPPAEAQAHNQPYVEPHIEPRPEPPRPEPPRPEPPRPEPLPNLHSEPLPEIQSVPQPVPHVDLATRLQNAIQMSAGGPKISPVVSKHAKVASTASMAATAQPVREPAPLSVGKAEPQLVGAIAQPENLPAQSANPIVQQTMAGSQSKAVQEIASSRLFNLDDPAIDKLFSENLGIHDRSTTIPTAGAPAEPAPMLPSAMSPVSVPQQTPVASLPAASAPVTIPQSFSSSQSQPLPQTAARQGSFPVRPPTNAKVDSPPVVAAETSKTSQTSQTSQSAPLFAMDDTAIDRIFSQNLGVPEQKDNMPANLNPPTQAIPFSPAPAVAPASSLTSAYASSSTAPIATPLSVAAPVSVPISTPSPAPSAPPPQKQESTTNVPISRQKITGVDRLDGRAEPTPEGGSGRIAAIGKFLLDNKDLEKIGKITASDLSERGMRTLSLEAHRELSNLLRQIDNQVGVIGTMIVGHDGLLIANTVPQELEAESLSKWAQAIYMGTTQVIEQLGSERVRQIVSQTERGYLIIANFGAGLLISLTNPLGIDHLLPLMRTITQLVAS